VHLLGARPAQGSRAFVDRGAGRVDVIHQRHARRACAGRERAAHVAATRGGVEATLRAHLARARDR
jgi:hypothetical protein